jgi:hypothetical protein
MSCSAADKLSALQIINGNDSWVQKRSNKHPYFENIYVPKSAKVTVLPATCENCIEIK